MSSNVLLDSYAWIEFFIGTPKGEKVRSHLDSADASTPMIVIAELAAKYAGQALSLWNERFEFIQQRTDILPLTIEIASEAGRIRERLRAERPNFGLADAIIYETARAHDLSVLSGDPHFKGLPNVIFLE